MIRIQRMPAMFLALLTTVTSASAGPAGDDPQADSPMVKLLKGGRVPADRQGPVIEMIGRRGNAADLAYIYHMALDPTATPAIRARSIEALTEAATTRGLKPAHDLEKLEPLLAGPSGAAGSTLREPAIRLAGAWKLASACGALEGIARSGDADGRTRDGAIEALATIGGDRGKQAILGLAGAGSTLPVRLSAVSSLVRIDADAAAALAADLIPAAAATGVDLRPLMAGFLNRRGAGEILAQALARRKIGLDAAKLALRAVYSSSQPDPALVDVLGKAAGIATEVKPLTRPQLSALVAEVAEKGDPARGESVFRRKDLNCMTCHAVAGAGGQIGPELSAIGQTSPVDYIISSIQLPDQAIKEQYQTLVVLTVEGQIYQGIVVDRDDRKVVLKEANGELRTVPVDAIEEQKAGGSLMPKGLVHLMTRAEFVDLVRFISELGKPGPYEIRTTPTIQRWRALKSPPASLTSSEPDAEGLRAEVLGSPAERWAPVYAKVSGGLPLDEASAVSGGGKVLYLQGEIDVTAPGTIRISPRTPGGLRFWVDDLAAPLGTREFDTSVNRGRHKITFRVDRNERKEPELRIEITKPSGSDVEFTVVGGS